MKATKMKTKTKQTDKQKLNTELGDRVLGFMLVEPHGTIKINTDENQGRLRLQEVYNKVLNAE